MSLKDTITSDLTTAMKAGEKTKTDTLRSIRASILEFEKSGIGREMNAEDELKILLTAAKKRKEALELYEANGRPELAEIEKAELDIINIYLPKQISRDDIEKRVSEVITELGATSPADVGKVISGLMKELKGKADGKVIQEIVKNKLTSES